MSPEIQNYVKVKQRAAEIAAKKQSSDTKYQENYPRNWGTSTNKRISMTASWRK